MQIYWTLKSIPELSALPPGERGRVWRVAYRETKRHWQYWAGLVGVGLCVGISAHIGGVIGAGVGGFVGGFIFQLVLSHFARRHIRDLLSPEHASGR